MSRALLKDDLSAFEQLYRRVRVQDPALDDSWLPADGLFQTRSMTLAAATRETAARLAEGFRGRPPAEFPTHYVAWGRARTGSTAFTNLFGMAGLPSYYQPVKAMLRMAMVDAPSTPWIPPMASEVPEIFTKETQGPYFLGECLFLPLQVLIEAGYPADKLQLVMLDRDPANCLASWLTKLSHLVPAAQLVRYYVLSALNALRVESYARRQGVPITHYVYEASQTPVRCVSALFARLGLSSRFGPGVVTDWTDSGDLASPRARIIHPQQPAIYDFPGLHSTDTAYHFRNGGTEITEAQMQLLSDSGIDALYQDSVDACIRDLGLTAAEAAGLFPGHAVPPDIRQQAARPHHP